jgi:hypothetical protein
MTACAAEAGGGRRRQRGRPSNRRAAPDRSGLVVDTKRRDDGQVRPGGKRPGPQEGSGREGVPGTGVPAAHQIGGSVVHYGDCSGL